MIDLSRYVIERLGDTGEHVISRATSLDSEPSVLLASAKAPRHPRATLERLERTFSLQDVFDPRFILKPLGVLTKRESPMLVMADSGGRLLGDVMGSEPMELGLFLRLAIGITASVGHIHERGYVHRDVKPGHVMVVTETGSAALGGIGLSLKLARHLQPAGPPNVMVGTPAYMAPEQTGRMNRSVDARSDLYALGVTFYQMLTAQLPFEADDPMELLHCQIARVPVPPSDRVRSIPETVSAIVMKLLAKSADDRYQTAGGVDHDLRLCLAACQAHGAIEPFPIGANDVSGRLLIPQRLYGRDAQLGLLLDAFEATVTDGATRLALVSGYSGIGKSSLVNELRKALVLPRGLFAAGKFDQFKRDVPYATLAQALRGLLRTLLTEDDEALKQWRGDLVEALGASAQLMVNLVPELERIIGPQPALPELPPGDARVLFQTVLLRFIGVFARAEHPLALFLDDLQWLDAATLDLLEQLATHAEVRHLLLVCAYRDNEVGPEHPLSHRMATIRAAGARLVPIELSPLPLEDLRHLLRDALHGKDRDVMPLATLLFEKTGGNPFFVIQFLSTLVEGDLLRFDAQERRWIWEIERIQAKGFTDNIVDLMLERIGRLSPGGQAALTHLACLGASASVRAVARISSQPEDQTREHLVEAEESGLVSLRDDTATFLHDRVQEAAYALVGEDDRPALHHRIGRELASGAGSEHAFDVVHQLNRATLVISSVAERDELAGWNLVAGKRARTATAFASALSYFAIGESLLDDARWQRDRSLAFDLAFHRAEAEILVGRMEEADARTEALLLHAEGLTQSAALTRLRCMMFTLRRDNVRGVEAGLAYLRRAGTDWSPHPSEADVASELQRVLQQLAGRSAPELLELPAATDADALASLDVLVEIFAPAVFTDMNLFALATLRAASISLEHGYSDPSAVAFANLGSLLCHVVGDPAGARTMSQLAYALVAERGFSRHEARVCLFVGGHIMQWTESLRAGRKLLLRAVAAARASGDNSYGAFADLHLIANGIAMGLPIADLHESMLHSLAFARKAEIFTTVNISIAQIAVFRFLTDLPPDFAEFETQERYETELPENLSTFVYWSGKAMAYFLAGDAATAVDALARAKPLVWTSGPFIERAEYETFGVLAHAARHDEVGPAEQANHLDELRGHHRLLETWAARSPETFETRAAIATAELARIEGRHWDAQKLYETAIRSARRHGYVQLEAIALHRAARFSTSHGLETTAPAYLRMARDAYLRWGAHRIVRELDAAHPGLAFEPSGLSATSSIHARVEQLDLATVIRISDSVAGEIDLEKIIRRLLATAVEHAGAERAVLLLPREGGALAIAADARTQTEGVTVRLRRGGDVASELPESVIHYVARTHETVVLDDTRSHTEYSRDPYLTGGAIRSVLCLPLIKQGTFVGLLYLENNLASNVFTPSRITVLRLLASQAAASLESARLYADLFRAEANLTEAQRLSHMGSFRANAARREFFWSEEARRIAGIERVIEPSLALILSQVHEEDRERVVPAVEHTLHSAGHVDLEYRIVVPDGTLKHCHLVAKSSLDEGGDNELVGTVIDITDRKRAEESLHRLHSELAHVTRVTTLGELAASIAHEVNQPLAGVLTNASTCQRWLSRDPPDLEQAREAIARITRDGKRATDVVSRLRSLFKRSDTTNEPLDIREILDEVVAFTRVEVSNHAATLRTAVDHDIPAVRGDKVQLQQVLLNLLLNAVHAVSGLEDGRREILVNARRDTSDRLVITVRDRGIGVAPDLKAKIFDAFFTTKDEGGMGMGLSISRSIVENHGGTLWTESPDGPGTVFAFTLGEPEMAHAL